MLHRSSASSPPSISRPQEQAITESVDPVTGHRLHQLTHLPGGATLGYFRLPRVLPDNSLLVHAPSHPDGHTFLLDPATGDLRPIPIGDGEYLKLRAADGRLWFTRDNGPVREVWHIDLPDGRPVQVAALPADVPGKIADITCDGNTVVLRDIVQDITTHPLPTTMDLDRFWGFFARPRHGRILTYDVRSGHVTTVLQTTGVCPLHLDASPTDPTLLRYCLDMYDGFGQRIWTVRTDGSDQRPIRPQQHGEIVTHEFWWGSAGSHIGYTYQDRRHDPTIREKPWSEYSPVHTQLGVADLAGREVYLSQPLNSYHEHLNVSPDGNWVYGEGNDGYPYLCAGRFCMTDPRLDLKPLATLHRPWIPFRGRNVHAAFSADSHWLFYNDFVDGQMQVFACPLPLDER